MTEAPVWGSVQLMKGLKVIRASLVILIILTTFLMLIPSPPEVNVRISFFDKIEHASVFAVLSFLLARSLSGFKNNRIRRFLTAVLIITAYGAVMEYLQILTGRNFELADIAADAAGAVAGGALSFFFFD